MNIRLREIPQRLVKLSSCCSQIDRHLCFSVWNTLLGETAVLCSDAHDAFTNVKSVFRCSSLYPKRKGRNFSGVDSGSQGLFSWFLDSLQQGHLIVQFHSCAFNFAQITRVNSVRCVHVITRSSIILWQTLCAFIFLRIRC